MNSNDLKIDTISHHGWENYYRDQKGAKAWNEVPDEFLLEHLNDILPAQGGNIIDVASGDGRNTAPFLGRGCNVVSMDLSPSALNSFRDRCAKDGVGSPVLLAGDFMALEFTERQFDVVVCFNGISHFPSIPQVLEKMCKLLAHGGKAAFNAFTAKDVAFGLGEKLQENTFFYRDTLSNFTSEGKIKEMLSHLDIKVVHSETRRWEEDDHGDYRTGKHTHEACFFIIQRI